MQGSTLANIRERENFRFMVAFKNKGLKPILSTLLSLLCLGFPKGKARFAGEACGKNVYSFPADSTRFSKRGPSLRVGKHFLYHYR